MANKKKQLGAVVDQVYGYRVRMMLDTKGKHDGSFGVFAGKNYIIGSSDKNISLAKHFILKNYSKN